MAIIIDFIEFKTKQEHKNSANVPALAQTNEILDFNIDLDLCNDWDDAEDIELMNDNRHFEAESNSHLNNTFCKLLEAIFISIKKILTVKDLNEH